MKRPWVTRSGGLAVAAAAVAVGGAAWGYSWYARERGALDTEIARYRADLERKQLDLTHQGAVRKRLAEIASDALGDTEEAVSASIRRALNEIAAECGLQNTSVTTRDATSERSPAVKAGVAEFKSASLRRTADRADFYSMQASFTGTGSLAQVMRALVTVGEQRWARRIESLTLTPLRSGRGDRMTISLTLATVFLPDVKPARAPAALWVKAGPAGLASVEYLVSKNAFRQPRGKPAVAAAPGPSPETSGEAGAPYGEWRVTAVVKGAAGPELWLVNERSRENLTLVIGQTVMDAVFVGAIGEVARLRIGEQEYEVGLAQTLQERRVVIR